MTIKQKSIKISIDGKNFDTSEGTILAKILNDHGLNVPTPCYHPGQKRKLVCKLCLIELEGSEKLRLSCMLKVTDGMMIKTKSERIYRQRKANLKVIFNKHYKDADCENCIWNGDCELTDLALEYGIIDKRKID